MVSNIKRSFSKRFSRTTDQSVPSSTSEPKTASTCASKHTVTSFTSASSIPPTTRTAAVTSNLAKAGFILADQGSPKRRSISKATISAPIPLSSSLCLNGLSSSPISQVHHAPTRPGNSRPVSNPPLDGYLTSQPRLLTPEAKKVTPSKNGVTIVDCGTPMTSALPSPTAAESTPSYSYLVAAPPGIPKDALPMPFNPSLPAYVLDRIHPCIPLPAPWNRDHDQYIVSLDVQDYHLPAIVRRLKQRFPELEGECVTPGMVDRRLRILDLRVDWQGWKRAISNMPPTGHVDDFDSSFDNYMAASSSTGNPRANHAKKVLTNVGNRVRHTRRISTGGMSGKITIDKRGTSVTNLTVGSPSSYSDSPLAAPYHLHKSSSGSASSFIMLNKRNSSPASPGMGSGTGAAPSSPSTPLTAPERAVEQLTQTRDFASESIRKMEMREWVDGLRTRQTGKGKGRVGNTLPAEVFGVPTVMRTSSGRPVLR